jgi:hypothetical protein
MSILSEMFHDPWLKDHQVVVAGAFAFGGSVLAAGALLMGYLLNATLNRRQLDRVRHQEATALAASLAAEIHNLGRQAEMLDGILAHFAGTITKAESEEGPSLRVSYVGPQQFSKVAEKLGLLGPLLTFNVIHFYFCFLDVFSGFEADSFKEGKFKGDRLTEAIEGMRRGLKIVTGDARDIVPQLLQFAHLQRPPQIPESWTDQLSKEPKYSVPADFDRHIWQQDRLPGKEATGVTPKAEELGKASLPSKPTS